jgi:Lhr-like helicase
MDVVSTTGRRSARQGRSVLSDLDPRLRAYMLDRIGRPTSLQEEAWADISSGSDVLVISPTGSGKTLAALAVPFDSILKGASDRSGVHVLYITPMKALGYDMLKNLKAMSDYIGPIPSRDRKAGRGKKKPDRSDPIAVEIRTGDVPQSLRRRMLVRPPDVLITTPENLLLMLCSSHRRILSKVQFAIVDEVHEMMRSKRGSMLSLSLEYLRSIVEEGGNGPLRTIGLSATASPREAARYIAGHGPNGRQRGISIVSSLDDKELMIEIRSLPEMEGGDKDIGEAVTSDIDEVLDRTKGSVVVFRNTRSGAEETAHALKAHGRDDVAPHHGSLGSDLRARAETGLRSGSLKCIVSSTSLELGIDVGSVGLCLQVSSPGDPTRLVQRFGRAGHGLGRQSEGIIYPLDAVDLLDSYAVSMAALRTTETSKAGIVMPYDVLAQFIVGLSLREGGTDQKEVLRLARRTSSFHGLRSSDVSAMVSLLTGRMSGKDPPRPRLWLKDGSIHPRRDTRQAFYLNSGTIPRETNYRVVEEGTRRVLGDLSREFGSSLYEGDVILLGSRSFRVRGFSGPAVRVREDRDAVPTIPRWSGEVPSRPSSVAAEVYRFWADGTPARPVRRRGARSLVLDDRSLEVLRRLRNEGVRDGWAPDRSRVPIEELPRKRGGSIYVFHLPDGRSVTDPLARIVALGIRRKFGAMADFVATDEGFAVASPAPLLPEDLRSFMDPEGLEDDLREMLYSSSYFDRSFAQCAGRSLLVLSRFGGRDTGAMYKRRSLAALSERIKAGVPRGTTASGPESGLMLIREEAMRETLKDRLDIPGVIGIASSINAGERAIAILPSRTSLGTVGERIVGDWGADLRSPTSLRPDLGSGPLPGGVPAQPLTAHISSAEASAIHLCILSGGPDIPPGSDPRTIIAEATLRGLSPEDLASDGHLLAVRHKGGVSYYDPRGIPKGADIPAPERILSWRRRLLRRRSGMRAVTEHVPFFTHPSEIASRARNLRYDDIRSALLSGRIVTFRAVGGLRVGDPRWALAWDVLSPRTDAACVTDRRRRTGMTRHGNAPLPPEMEDMAGPGIPDLTARTAERPEQGDRSFEAERRLLHVMNMMGPMTVSDLTRSFSWDGGPVPIALRALIADGSALSGLGSADPTGSSKELSIWFWSAEWARERPEERRDEAARDDGWCNSTDPYFLLYGKTYDTAAGPRVKGAAGLVLVRIRNGIEAGKAYISQGGDLVRVHDIEVRDYLDVGTASGSLLGTLDAFSRLGYDLITVEGIMGVPAPEGASAALGVLAEGGFSEPVGGGSRVLARGFSRIERIGRSVIVASMLMHQCLIDGYHFTHPLEAILRNLSIADRWEALSRLGSSRHGSISADCVKEAIGRVPMRIRDLCGSITTGEMPDVPSISDLISADREPLPEGKDLMRKLDLERGSLDQPGLVWSARQVLRSYPPPDRSADLSRLERDLVYYVGLGSDRSKEHPGLAERSEEVDGLMRRGFLTVDAWGRHHILKDRRRTLRPRVSSEPPRGVLLRAFLLSSALSLGMFTFRDIVALSPGLGPPGRVRTMLSDLCRTHLDRYVTDEPTMEVVYLMKGLDLDRVREVSQIIADEGAVTVISPKDRMARVLSGDFSARLGGVRGHLVLKGAEPAALVGFRRAPRTHADEQDPRTRGRLLISSVKRGHLWRADALIREVRRRMFEMGFDTVTEADLERERSLYRGP